MMSKFDFFNKKFKLKEIFKKDLFKNLKNKNEEEDKDFNFFSPYIDKKREKKLSIVFLLGTASIVFVIIVTSFLWNFFTIRTLEKDITNCNTILNSKEVKENEKQYEALNKKWEFLKKYNEGVTSVSNNISKKEQINSELMQKITSYIPKELCFKSLHMNNDNLDINGTAKTRVQIAEFEYNLRGIEEIKDVHISNISKNSSKTITDGKILTNVENDFNFTIKCNLKEVDKK